MADVAEKLALPVILVVGLRLGCLNHALLTREAMRARGLPFAGWIANKMRDRNAAGEREYRHAERAALACRRWPSCRRACTGRTLGPTPVPAWAVEAGKEARKSLSKPANSLV